MAYIEWNIDGEIYKTWCGKITGIIFESGGSMSLLSRPTIQYFGDDLSEILPCDKIWSSVKIKDENGNWVSLTVTVDNMFPIEKAVGLMTNNSINVGSTSEMPAVVSQEQKVIISYQGYVFFSYSPYYNKVYNCPACASTKTPSGSNIISTKNTQALGHYMLFIIYNDLGAWEKKKVLYSTQPFTMVVSHLYFSFIEKLSNGATAWGNVFSHYAVRIMWDKEYKDLYNPTNYPYRYKDNKCIGYNMDWFNQPVIDLLTETNAGHTIYMSLLASQAPGWTTEMSRSIMRNLNINMVTNIEDEIPPDTDNPPDDDTTGDGDDTSDDIDFPTPVLNITDFVTIYNFKKEQLKTLASNIWNNNFLDNLLKLTNNALDCIICFNAYNFDITTQSTEHVTIGNVTFDMGAEIIENAYQTINMGTINIMPFFGDYRDYTNTRISIFLPFIGMKQLDVEQVQGNKLTLKYIVDTLTGECIAMLKVSNTKFNSITQTFKGKCNYSIPLGGENYSRLNSDIASSILTKSPINMANGIIQSFARTKNVSIGNNLGGNVAIANIKTPYLLFERYETLNPIIWAKWENWKSYYEQPMNTLKGLTQCRTSQLNIPLAQENEIEEIKQLLQQGVVF